MCTLVIKGVKIMRLDFSTYTMSSSKIWQMNIIFEMHALELLKSMSFVSSLPNLASSLNHNLHHQIHFFAPSLLSLWPWPWQCILNSPACFACKCTNALYIPTVSIWLVAAPIMVDTIDNAGTTFELAFLPQTRL